MKVTRVYIAGIIAAVVMAGIIGIVGFSNDSDIKKNSKTRTILEENPEIELHNAAEELTEKEKLAIKLVQQHNGQDGEGENIAYLLGKIISSKYSDDLIYDPETDLGWSAYEDPDNPELYGVAFDFKSDIDDFSFLWYVDLQDKVIYAVGGGAQELLNIVDSKK
ncbi:MAG TPA: hypothetical protein VFG25_05065 [Nitrosopumilaceae archaeon]|nr:hypothetical protein [Nitrosopumilaceae archaeon]